MTGVEEVVGYHDFYPHRRWRTWRVTLDGTFLGTASSEAEGWRWIADMQELDAKT